MCVAVLYSALRSSSGMSFFIPGLNRPVCPVKRELIIFYDHKNPLGVPEGLRSNFIFSFFFPEINRENHDEDGNDGFIRRLF